MPKGESDPNSKKREENANANSTERKKRALCGKFSEENKDREKHFRCRTISEKNNHQKKKKRISISLKKGRKGGGNKKRIYLLTRGGRTVVEERGKRSGEKTDLRERPETLRGREGGRGPSISRWEEGEGTGIGRGSKKKGSAGRAFKQRSLGIPSPSNELRDTERGEEKIKSIGVGGKGRELLIMEDREKRGLIIPGSSHEGATTGGEKRGGGQSTFSRGGNPRVTFPKKSPKRRMLAR